MGKAFGEGLVSGAIADCARHHCYAIKIMGGSYRLRGLSRERGGGRRIAENGEGSLAELVKMR